MKLPSISPANAVAHHREKSGVQRHVNHSIVYRSLVYVVKKRKANINILHQLNETKKILATLKKPISVICH